MIHAQKLRYIGIKIFAALRVRKPIGGIDISDQGARFASFDGKAWRTASVRFEPGALEAGKTRDRAKLVSALKELKAQAFGDKKSSRQSVIVSLSSISIYSQVFSLPIISGENLDRAIKLNVQMVSPVDAAQAYSGWQTVGKDEGSLRLEILSAFIDRAAVDEIAQALREAGFIAVVMEPRALSLARLFRERGGADLEKSYILANIDNSGVDFLVIRGGQLYFEYFNPWQDIADEKGQISTEAFESAFIRSLRQVTNFCGQHWPEPVSELVLSATAMREETEKIIAENFPLAVREFTLEGQTLGPEWFVALGCGLRGAKPRAEDTDMSLLGIGAQEEFRREQILAFAEFWRLLTPIALGVLLVSFLLTHAFLSQTRARIESKNLFAVNVDSGESQALQLKAREFNKTVKLIGATRGSQFSKYNLIEKIRGLSSSSGVFISRFYFQGIENPALFGGEVASQEKLSLFKKSLEADPLFSDVSLSLSDVRVNPRGLAFSLTFRVRQ